MSAHALIVFENSISFFAHILIAFVHALIVFENPIRLRAHTLILSACTLIASTLPSNTAYSSTVPGGDTPCLTAGDAQRANPWIGDVQTSDAGSVAQHPLPPSQEFIFSLSHRYVVTL